MLLKYSLTFFAGILTVLSPCILPTLPLIITSALQKNKYAPLIIMLGLITALTLVGLLLGLVLFSLQLNEVHIRTPIAIVIIFIGTSILLPIKFNPLNRWFNQLANLTNPPTSLTNSKQLFVLGLCLGAVWSPCSGPVLATIMGLTLLNQTWYEAIFIFILFGVGTSIPLLLFSYGLRHLIIKHQHNLIKIQKIGIQLLAISLILIGFLIVTGLDLSLQTFVINHLPDWWIKLLSLI